MTDTTPGALGRYEIQGILGKGAMGVVYKARDPLIGRTLAIKTFRTAYLGDEHEAREFRARFLREAQSAGILNHPNIVTIHDVVEESEEGVTFIAMEYVEGTNLKDVLRRSDALDLDRITHIVSEVADALDYAHERGVIHRDIKPANILLTKAGRVKLTDFGIARLEASDLTQDGQLLGTPNYMAPERILGREVDRRTDVFSLGVVLYEMLTRQKPFRGDNLTMVTHRIVYEPFTPPADYDRDLPGEVVHVLDKAMAKEPAARFATAGEMAAELQLATTLAHQSGFVMLPGTEPSREEVEEDDTTEAGPGTDPEAAEDPGAETRDVSDHAVRAAALGAERELSDVEGFLGSEASGWAGEPPGGQISPEETIAARIEHPLAGTGEEPPPPPPGPAPRSAAPHVPANAGTRLRELTGRFPKASLVGAALALGLLLLLAIAAAVFWPGGDPEEGAARVEAPVQAVSTSPAERSLDRARAALDAGELGRADRYVREGLLAAPEDPDLLALRAEVGAALTEAELSAERVAQLRSWLGSARAALDGGRLAEAEATVAKILLLAPEHEEARELERRVAEARQAAERARRARREESAQPDPEPEPESEEAAVESDERKEPEPTHFELSILFLTEISEGTLTIYAGDQQIVREPFDFRKRTGIFKVEESSGQIEIPARRLPRGETTLRIYVARQGQSPLVETVRQTFEGGDDHRLRIVVRKGGGMLVSVE